MPTALLSVRRNASTDWLDRPRPKGNYGNQSVCNWEKKGYDIWMMGTVRRALDGDQQKIEQNR